MGCKSSKPIICFIVLVPEEGNILFIGHDFSHAQKVFYSNRDLSGLELLEVHMDRNTGSSIQKPIIHYHSHPVI